MRLTNTLATIMLAAFLVVGLSACGKKKNSNASTPGSACIFNGMTYVNAQGQYCNPAATQIQCPANGIYTNQYGQSQPCTPGQMINTGGAYGGYGYGGQYPYGGYAGYGQQGAGCDIYYYQYGIQYVPVILSGQLQCMRIDLLNQYAKGTPYYNNYDYYYAYPPYSYGGSGYCGTQVGVSFQGFSGMMCF